MGGLRRAGVLGICLTLLLVGLVLALAAGPVPIKAPFAFPAVLLLPIYLAAERRKLDFEFRKDNISISLTQLPLALGLLLTPLAWHLTFRLAAVLLDSVILRRLSVQKTGFNAGTSVFEFGLAAALVGTSTQMSTPGARLWLLLFVGLFAGDVFGHFALQLIFRLLGRQNTKEDFVQILALAALTSLVFTSLAVIAISAAWTDSWTIFLTVGLALALAVAYRGFRRQSSREQSTEKLFAFVKDLRPVSLESPEVRDVLEKVRVLLHSRFLNLAICESTGSWRHITIWDADDLYPHRSAPSSSSPRLEVPSDTGAAQQRISTSILGAEGVLGVLTAEHRLGNIRGFDLADLRLMETVGAELATAFERGRLLADLQRAATTDALTGLPNLHDTNRLVEGLLDVAPRGVVLAVVSVDSFREVNDTLGHEVGDALLVEVARRLERAAPGAVVGRMGGGRFAVAVDAEDVAHDAGMFGLSVRAAVEGSADIHAIGLHVKLALGCAVAPEHGRDASTLVRRAETAMYGARHAGGGPTIWEPAYEIDGQRRMAVLSALREALSIGAISVAYQPKVAASSGLVTGVEALARWTHPALGPVTPDEFIPLAEASGLMGPLTSAVMRQSLLACKSWQLREGHVGVAVNVNAETVLEPGFVSEVAAILRATGVAPRLLTIELTESIVVRDPALAVARMGELRALGVKLAVDDFGTGYSSLTYLKGLPVDEVKIDKGFIDGLATAPSDRAVVRAVVDIAHTLGLRVVAEGVEQAAQQGILRALGVDELQGYLYARPMPFVETVAWLRERDAAPMTALRQ